VWCLNTSLALIGAIVDGSRPTIGPLMLYEVVVAFFLEAGFLGIMLFGRKKVGEASLLSVDVVCCYRLLVQRVLDSLRKLLATNASWIEYFSGRAVRAETLVQSHIQPIVPISLGAHEPGCFPCHGISRRCGGGVALVAQQQQSRFPLDVFHGAMDGDSGYADPDHRGRSTRGKYLGIPAAEGGSNGGRLGSKSSRGWGTVSVVRHTRHKGRTQSSWSIYTSSRISLSSAQLAGDDQVVKRIFPGRHTPGGCRLFRF